MGKALREKEKNAGDQQLLAPLAVGQRAYVMARCPLCVRLAVRPCVRVSIRTNESVLKWLGLGWVRVSFPLVYIIVT